MNLQDQIITIYQYFCNKVSKNKYFTFIPTKSEEKSIETLITFLSKKSSKSLVTSELLFSYFSFQFEYWSNKTTTFGKGKVMLNWVVGKKAFERWNNKTNVTFFYEKFCRENNIKKSEILSIINYTETKQNNNNALFRLEEVERKRFLNKTLGLQHCLGLTSLFNEQSSSCNTCNSSIKCREILMKKAA